jgi:predicted GTPase
MAPKRRSQTTQEMVVDTSQNDKSYPKPKYNIAMVGTISSGKSTLLNAIFGKTYSEMKIRRTTMIPSEYNLAQIDEADLSTIQETNNKLNEK